MGQTPQAPLQLPIGAQFNRSVSLILSKQASIAGVDVETSLLDLTADATQLPKITFKIEANDVETPNTAIIRVYNLSAATVKTAIAEYTNVMLAAGYGQNIGTIFTGTIKQFRRGKERNVDSYLDILAADGDINYNFGFSNETIAAGSTPQQRLNQYAQSMGVPLDPHAAETVGTFTSGGILPRGKVLFGLTRVLMADMANSASSRWSIQNGVLVLVPNTSYLPGDTVVLNSETGMIGIPEATDQGINVQMLLNPGLHPGRLLKLNNADITATTIKQQLFPAYTDYNFVATVDSSADGLYRVIVVEHVGDTRDQDWYTNATCLLIDKSTSVDNSVQQFG